MNVIPLNLNQQETGIKNQNGITSRCQTNRRGTQDVAVELESEGKCKTANGRTMFTLEKRDRIRRTLLDLWPLKTVY